MNPVDEFGQVVVANFRDKAIDFTDGLLAGRWNSPGTQDLGAALSRLSAQQREVVRRCVVDSLDAGVHDFLFALGEAHDRDGGIAVLVDGEDVAGLSDGLHGEPYGDDGWYARFSKHGPPADPA